MKSAVPAPFTVSRIFDKLIAREKGCAGGGTVWCGMRHKIGSVSQHISELRKNHMVQAWVLGLSWMTGPVERLLWAGVSWSAVIVFNLRV